MSLVYLGLGSNLGNGRENLTRAIEALQDDAGAVVAVSSFVNSEPWGFRSANMFTNAVVAIETLLAPEVLLDCTQRIERQMGRLSGRKEGEPYEDRIIDIDILYYDDLHIQTARLTIPHPLIQQRPFVLEPLRECRALVLSQQ